jgi:hypothetical protein
MVARAAEIVADFLLEHGMQNGYDTFVRGNLTRGEFEIHLGSGKPKDAGEQEKYKHLLIAELDRHGLKNNLQLVADIMCRTTSWEGTWYQTEVVVGSTRIAGLSDARARARARARAEALVPELAALERLGRNSHINEQPQLAEKVWRLAAEIKEELVRQERLGKKAEAEKPKLPSNEVVSEGTGEGTQAEEKSEER